jgi:hypothetical protein
LLLQPIARFSCTAKERNLGINIPQKFRGNFHQREKSHKNLEVCFEEVGAKRPVSENYKLETPMRLVSRLLSA